MKEKLLWGFSISFLMFFFFWGRQSKILRSTSSTFETKAESQVKNFDLKKRENKITKKSSASPEPQDEEKSRTPSSFSDQVSSKKKIQTYYKKMLPKDIDFKLQVVKESEKNVIFNISTFKNGIKKGSHSGSYSPSDNKVIKTWNQTWSERKPQSIPITGEGRIAE